MKITFLGTNGWYDTNTGNTISILVETKKAYIVLDAGNGFYKVDQYIKDKKPVYLFVSHLHLDHIIGLHMLAKLNFSQGIIIVLPEKLKRSFDKIMDTPYTMPLSRLPYKIEVKTFKNTITLPVGVEAFKLNHPSACWGYRFKEDGKILAYGPDTGLCENLYKLAEDADVLITECSWLPGEKHEGWTHLNPQDAAGLAQKANTGKLILTHFDASRYTSLGKRKQAQRVARKIFKNTFVARDNQVITL